MITLDEYIGVHANSPDWTPARKANASKLLDAAAKLMAMAAQDGVVFKKNPKTGSCVSGQTFGGFRPQSCSQGAPKSNHKQGRGIDIYDPDNKIDEWCMKNLDKLEAAGIWIEHPSKTDTWSHWQDVPPRSGRRVFMP